MAIQPDGKIVVAGFGSNETADLARYKADGTLDPTFSGDGKAVSSLLAGQDMALQQDGKIVVAGYSFNVSDNTEDAAVLRLNADGTKDTSFGTGGLVLTDYKLHDDFGHSVAIQSDGKIVVAGATRLLTPPLSLTSLLVRYDTSGNLDPTFNRDGIRLTSFPGTDSSGFNDVVLQPGRIIAAGGAESGSDGMFAIARYRAGGRLDTAFSTDGLVLTNFGPLDDSADAISLQSDRKIVVGGRAQGSADYDFALARYNIDGSLDPTFGLDGQVLTDFIQGDDEAEDVAIQSDGKVIAVGGDPFFPPSGDFELARYSSDGSLDSSFGSMGEVLTDFGSDYDGAEAVAIQADGKIVVVGTATMSTLDMAVARYMAA